MDNEILQALTGIEIALREISPDNKKPDEFTVRDLMSKADAEGQSLTYDAAQKRLTKLVEKKILKVRKVIIESRNTRVYSAY